MVEAFAALLDIYGYVFTWPIPFCIWKVNHIEIKLVLSIIDSSYDSFFHE